MSSQSYLFNLAKTPQEIAAYFELRRSIFVEEQGLFQGSDVDELDTIAYPIIALTNNQDLHEEARIETHRHLETQHLELKTQNPTPHPTPHTPHPLKVLGIVRIYEPEPGLWYGGRLGVHRDYRRTGRIGKGLIDKAVTTANTWGCQRFLATVQLQNVRFFQRLHWNSLKEITICGLPHHLMEADLNYYPPGTESRPIMPFPVPEAS